MTEKEDFLLDLALMKDKESKAAWHLVNSRGDEIEMLNGQIKDNRIKMNGMIGAVEGFLAVNYADFRQYNHAQAKSKFNYEVFRLWQIWDSNKGGIV